MSLALTPPVRVLALIGALVLTAVAAFVFLVGRGVVGSNGSDSAATTKQPSAAVASHAAPAVPKTSKPRVVPRAPSGFPLAVDHALQYNRVVVVTVYMPKAAVDATVRAEARAAAKTAHAGYVAISAYNETALGALVAKAGVLPDPAVVIVRRPGVVSGTFSVADRETIAQAVAEARR